MKYTKLTNSDAREQAIIFTIIHAISTYFFALRVTSGRKEIANGLKVVLDE